MTEMSGAGRRRAGRRGVARGGAAGRAARVVGLAWVARAAVAVAVVGALGGCFAYVPAELGGVEVGDRVRAIVVPGAIEDPGTAVDPVGPVIAGRVLARGADTLLLRVPLAVRPGAVSGAPLARHVAIPAPAIRQVDVRVLQRGRTAALVAGTAALLGVVVYQAFIRTDPAGTGGENPPPSDEALRPTRPLPGPR